MFSPIAIVGIGCVLPDAETPSAFWDMCVQNRSVIRSATAETWQVSKLETVTSTVKNPLDGAYTYAGARVDRVQFEHRWRRLASENKLLEDRLVVDEHVRWSLCAANEALKPIHALHHTTYKTGVILGNLSFPTWEMNSLGGASWLRFHGQPVPESIPPVHSESRWMSSSPAQHIAQTWGMTAESYCIDAACASSLYAIALASEALHAGHADVMLAGAVNGADNLFLHVGFSALHALSQGGVAKPFDQGADGLIPAEGCAMVSIMRLADAEKAGLPIQAVIRGVGLSNDGRARNLLAPSSAGQIMAMRRAYAKARLTPDDVDLIECHATGTLVGDKTEIASIKEVFAPHGHRAKKLWASSHKGNCGHLITVAGMAGLIKSIGSIQQGMIAPTAQLHHKINEIEKESSWLEVPNQSVSWNTSESSSAPRRVGINAFGFGGNNAHLIIEEYKTAHTRNTLDRPHVSSSPQGIHEPSLSSASLAVVAMLKKTRDFDEPCVVHANGLKIPPADMMHCLPQQLLSFEACREIWAHLENQDVFASLQGSEKSVIMAMETDMDVTTPSVRWRWDTWLTNQDRSQREILTHEMHSATVLGCMPNIVANRVNMHEDFRGPSFSLSASDASLSAGLHAAKSCLTQHDVKVVLLGATDIVSDIRHQDAVAAQGLQAQSMQDGAWIFAITTKEWAQQHQVPIKALLTVTDSESLDSSVQRLISTPQGNVIHAYAQLYNRLEKLSSHEESQGISPCTLTSQTLWGHSASVILSPCADSPSSNITSRPLLYVFAAQDEKTLQEALVKKKIWEDLSEVPPVRLAFVARNTSHAHQLIQACLTYWREGANHPWPQEVFWSREPSFTEENAMWVFGSTMMLAPQFALDEALTWWSMYAETARKQCGEGAWETWLYRGEKPESCLQQINIQSCVAQLHASLWKTHIQSKVRNAMGLSLGESNALLATGIWSDPSAVLYDCGQTGLFTEKVAGAQTHVVFSDGRPSHGKFMSALVRGDMDSIRKALLNYPLLHCLIEHDGHEGIIGGPHDVLTTWLKTRRIPHVLLPYAPVAHCQAVSSTKDVYRALHHRNTKTHNVRIYSHGVSAEKGHRLELHADAIADAILHQFTHSVSFPSVIQQAYLDGVRWFIDMSPHGFVSRWLKRILQKKNDVHIVSMTGAHGRPEHWLQTLAMLFVNGAQLSSSAQEVLYSSTSVPLSWPASTAKKHDTPAMDSSVASEATADRLNMPLMPLGEHSLHMQSSIKQSLPLSVAPSSSPVTSSISSTKPNVKSDLRKIWPHEKIRRMAAPISLFTANITSQHGHMIEEKESAQTWRHRLLLSPKWHTQDILSVDGLLNPKMSYTVSQAPDSMLAYNDVWQQWYASIGQSHEYFLQQAIHNYQIWQNSHVYYMEQLSIPQNLQHFSMLNHSPIHAFSTQTSASLDATPRRDMIPQSSIPKMAVLWNRSDLENLASGDIADYFGPAFQIQKDFKRQVRMPQPPLLLCDRVMSTTAKAGILEPHQSMETQTDIAWNSWYLHDGRIPAGVLIESGQADLLLISYMGVDWENRGERVYRLLGCEVTYVAPLPLAGNTVHHHIVIDGFAQTNQTRIFFFHSDCTLFHNASPVMHVRQGQAGFFTDEELAHSNGVLWKPEDVSIHEVAAKYIHSISPLESHGKILKQQQWESTALQAFSQGHIADCFGETYSQAKTHRCSPRIDDGKMLLLKRVTHCDMQGGPWQRGYARAEWDFSPQDWFFEGHFKDDPCMPGTLMFQACLQLGAFYIAACGYTLDKDGYHFMPTLHASMPLRCRGQATPTSQKAVYELFIKGIRDGDEPTLVADVLVTIDGLKSLHAENMSLTLARDWPLRTLQHWAEDDSIFDQHILQNIPKGEQSPLAAQQAYSSKAGVAPRTTRGAFALQESFASARALLATGIGRPSEAMGSMYQGFDQHGRVPRLPGPPYHFMSEILSIEGPAREAGALVRGINPVGTTVTVLYSPPETSWYFDGAFHQAEETMPFAVLLEIALQPCGWLSSWIGSACTTEKPLSYRNLDGTMTIHKPVMRGLAKLRTTVILKEASASGGMMIQSFALRVDDDEGCVAEGTTVFGFFPPEALQRQVGVGQNAEETQAIKILAQQKPYPTPPLLPLTQHSFQHDVSATKELSSRWMLSLLDDVVHFTTDEQGGGRIVMRKTMHEDAWFFKAHFFTDPVQPGSLGLEAMLQALWQWIALRLQQQNTSQIKGIPRCMHGSVPFTWKYRGQVIPKQSPLMVDVRVHACKETLQSGDVITADASLWIGEMKIYTAQGLSIELL